ncbi:MAG: hypothetical protein ABH817_01120 [archaeon]
MKKEVTLVLVLLIGLLYISQVYAEEITEEEQVNNAYQWLIDHITDWDDLNLKQHSFGYLALNCNDTIVEIANSSLYDKSVSLNNQRCFGETSSSRSGNCKITETALAKIAINEFDETEDIDTWLLGQNKTQVSGLYWYLQIDVERGNTAICEVVYADKIDTGFRIKEDKSVELRSTIGSECFEVDHNNYWFKIKESEKCYNYRYTIKCWSQSPYYTATLLYKTDLFNNQWYVSSETATGTPGSGTVEPQIPKDLRIQSLCLKDPGSNECTYEGTAWAAYAFSREGDSENANLFLPYLVVFQNAYIKYFPSSFLANLIGGNYEKKVMELQQPEGYWLIQPITYGRLYDTSKGGLAIGNSENVSKAKEYILKIQERNGLFNINDPGKDIIRDQAFALWVYWPEYCPGERGRGGGGSTGNRTCEEARGVCKDELFGCNPLTENEENYWCPEEQVCCKARLLEDDCQDTGGFCRTSCLPTEYEDIYTFCDQIDNRCCKNYQETNCEDAGGERCEIGTCLAGEIYETNDTLNCCIGGICSQSDPSEQRCVQDLFGDVCELDEICVDSFSWIIEETITTLGPEECCLGECVVDETCLNYGGDECTSNQECVGQTAKTRDTDVCCIGECLESCYDQNGKFCDTGETCSGSLKRSTEYPTSNECCLGTCSGGTPARRSSIWIWIIVIALIIGAVLVYFFIFKKKPRKKKDEGFGGILGIQPRGPSVPPRRAPLVPATTTRPSLRTFRRPIINKPTVKHVIKETKMPEAPKPSELEKTLSKLKKMTKK